MLTVKAKDALIQQLIAQGVGTIFGNPGTVEESLLDALSDHSKIRYIHGLQETGVLAMADGYARVSKSPGVAQLHSAVGLGNAVSILYEAHRSFTPMVVFAGEVPYDLQAFDGFLAGDLAAIARPVTKWSTRVTSGNQLLRTVRRAFKVAVTPPQGPVFLALPMNVLEEEIELDIQPASTVRWNSHPGDREISEIAALLIKAEHPLMLVGDGVALSQATQEVILLSELIGCPIYGVDFADLDVPFSHPLFMGLIGHSFGSQTRKITLQADVIIAVGTPLFPELFPVLEPYFVSEAKLIQIDLNPWEIAKNYPVTVGVLADPKCTLAAVCNRIKGLSDDEIRKTAEQRRNQWNSKKRSDWDTTETAYKKIRDGIPIAPSRLMEEVVNNMPSGTLVYDESITATSQLLHYLMPSDPELYFLGRGGCIGVGSPGAIGAALARPDRKVLALSGDGSALYVFQCLWTARKYNLNIVFLVCNNRSYRILKINLLQYWADSGTAPREFPKCFDLNSPDINFSALAEGFGVEACRITKPEELSDALVRAYSTNGPSLIDVVIDGTL